MKKATIILITLLVSCFFVTSSAELDDIETLQQLGEAILIANKKDDLETLTEYQIAEIGVRVSLSQDWICADRSATDDNPICSFLGMTAKRYIEEFLEDDIYMHAYNTKNGAVLYLTVNEAHCSDYSTIDDILIQEELSKQVELMKSFGDRISYSDTVELNVPYYRIVSFNGEFEIYEYNTVKDGKEYVLEFFTSLEAPILSTRDKFDSIVGSVIFPVE